MLIASGMDTTVRDMDGLTPADLANECGHKDCEMFLRSPSQVYIAMNFVSTLY